MLVLPALGASKIIRSESVVDPPAFVFFTAACRGFQAKIRSNDDPPWPESSEGFQYWLVLDCPNELDVEAILQYVSHCLAGLGIPHMLDEDY